MSSGGPVVDQVDPETAFRLLEENPTAQMIDVRTRAEWAFVGIPDLAVLDRQIWPIEWVSFPSMAPSNDFVGELNSLIASNGTGVPAHLLFICRSGSRSMFAAQAVAASFGGETGLARCTNVAEGFEGDLDEEGHRGRINGWKARGLPWRQN